MYHNVHLTLTQCSIKYISIKLGEKEYTHQRAKQTTTLQVDTL